jgi:hypothetical protein
LSPDAIAAKPAMLPSSVASVPSGGSAGRTSPSIPSPHWSSGTIATATITNVARMNPTITRFTNSSVREMR